MRFTRFRSQRNATGIFSKSEAALEQPRKVCAARLFRRRPNPPTEQTRESARGCEPSRIPSPRGCRGAERPTPAPSGTKAPARTVPRLRRRSKPSTEQARKNMRRCSKRAARLFRQEPKFRLTSRESMCAAAPNALPACPVGNQPFRSNSPGRAREGVTPLVPRPRGGCRGAERPTSRAVGNEIPARTAAKAKAPMNATRRALVLSGTKFSCKPPRKQKCRRQKPAARLFRRRPNPPTEQPRESARGCEPSRIPSPRGCRGAERPTLASSGTKIFIRILRESSRGSQPSRLPIEAGDLRGGKVACPRGKQVASRPTKRNRRFRLVAPGADFFGGEPAPRRKNRFLADSAPGNPQDFSGI